MNWLTNFVRPRIRGLVSKKSEAPEPLWTKCPKCGQMIFQADLEANLNVCPHCDHHMRIGPSERFAHIFDDGEHQRIELPEVIEDPLKFRDEKRYTERLKETRSKTGETEAVAVAHGRIGGNQAVVAVQNFSFMGGSLGLAAGAALIAAARLAVLQQGAFVVFAAAGGARMHEGILSLMQLPRTTIAVEEVREAGLPYIVVLTDPTTGGVTASYAMLGDIAVAEPDALIGFAGPRVIENTIHEQLPEGFQRSEYLYEHGMLDMVVRRHELRATLARIIDLLINRSPTAEIVALPQAELEIPSPLDAVPPADADAPEDEGGRPEK